MQEVAEVKTYTAFRKGSFKLMYNPEKNKYFLYDPEVKNQDKLYLEHLFERIFSFIKYHDLVKQKTLNDDEDILHMGAETKPGKYQLTAIIKDKELFYNLCIAELL